MIAAKEFRGNLMQIIFDSTNKQTNEATIFGFTVVKFPGTTYCKYCTEQVQLCDLIVSRTFQSDSALYSCLNVKELLAQNRCDIRSLSDSNGIRAHDHLARKQHSTI